ncbi:hypothetical protein SAICODRAFT_26504 [Saitoella complicata NRRL Y-17804]|uniref:PIH1 N-terminal domain-containing protein n=1 Tax=Saitoella complicata (strain BCRC 22490 / CBS 7301 / JCM 7358 / NBRC 10748 / NRRL Y-17804) TaxID=698492 RepID=A0A0E9NLA1_SAICN|nr:uncharacterized protein SAICODRAFT_26504 [Saitoella complicata NRRL Y-17804]ODQ51757.1 hypothetical protein SAICODRAFT_26504 [Saitoella complicata NRRL Y-17804]GAO50624.1 hypothetical protein G7K_4748-t1 [Saitoella complicata NRRL Y-17804]
MPTLDFDDAPATSRLSSLSIIGSSSESRTPVSEKNDAAIGGRLSTGATRVSIPGAKKLDVDDAEMVTPEPGFVVKTLNTTSTKRRHPQGSKAFLNICHSKQMTAPSTLPDQGLMSHLRAGGDWDIPLHTTPPRQDVDKAGRECLVVDCCVHTSVLRASLRDPEVKMYLIEVCLERVEDESGMVLSREYAVPNMRSKGALEKSVPVGSAIGKETVTGIQVLTENQVKEKAAITELRSAPTPTPAKPLIQAIETKETARLAAPALKKATYVVSQLLTRSKVKIEFSVPLLRALGDASLDLLATYEPSKAKLVFAVTNVYEDTTVVLDGVRVTEDAVQAYWVRKEGKLVVAVDKT